MLIPRFRYATMKFPYNFNGLVASHQEQVEVFTKLLFGDDIGEGCCFAYQNLLESLITSDQDFLKENCDKQIANQFIWGIQQLKKEGKELKLRYDDQCNLNLMYANFSFHLFSDPQKDLRDQTPEKVHTTPSQLSLYIYDGFKKIAGLEIPRPIFELNLFVCHPCSLAINDENITKDLYHNIEFRTHSIGGMSILKLQEYNKQVFNLMQTARHDVVEKTILLQELLGSDYSWKITNFDKCLK